LRRSIKEEETNMKRPASVPAFVGTSVAFLLASLTAHARHSRSFELAQPVSLAGTEIVPGVYEVEWQAHSPEVTVTLRAGKRTVATATGKWVERQMKYNRDAFICQTGEGRLARVLEVQFAGKSQVLVLDEPASEAQMTSMLIPLCAVSARSDETRSRPGDGCEQIHFLGKPTTTSRDSFPADPSFSDGFPDRSRTPILQRK
jgi:hypothetical protein